MFTTYSRDEKIPPKRAVQGKRFGANFESPLFLMEKQELASLWRLYCRLFLRWPSKFSAEDCQNPRLTLESFRHCSLFSFFLNFFSRPESFNSLPVKGLLPRTTSAKQYICGVALACISVLFSREYSHFRLVRIQLTRNFSLHARKPLVQNQIALTHILNGFG